MRISHMKTASRHSTDFKLYREKGTADFLFVQFRSPAKLWVDGEYVTVNIGDCVLFDKNAKQSYYPEPDNDFFHDFMHFDTETEEESVLVASIPKNSVIHVLMPSRITDCLGYIEKNRFTNLPDSREILTALGIAFIYFLRSEIKSADKFRNHSKLFFVMSELRNRIYNEPEKKWNVDEICSSLYISRSYFHHQYKAFFGISCIDDVTRARIERSKTMLIGSGISVGEIALECGYNNTEHYIRQFKRFVGVTPGVYRKSSR